MRAGWSASLLLLLVAGRPVHGEVDTGPSWAGTVLPQAPQLAPGRIADEPKDRLALGRQYWEEGDPTGVVNVLSPWLDGKAGPWGRTRASGHLLLGLAHMELQNWNMASSHFYRVRRSDGPLQELGAWYEALVDHKRGRHLVAIKECKQYRETWPDGLKADECLLLIGDAFAAENNRWASVSSYKEYLDKHPDSVRKEEINLAIAMANVQASPKSAIPALQALVLSHNYHSTAMTAQAALDELAEQGLDTTLPNDTRSLMLRAESARRCGRWEESWALYQTIAARGDDDPEAARWAEDNEDRLAWSNRKFDVYINALLHDYEDKPDGEIAWKIFKAYERDGQWRAAVEIGHKALEGHKTHHRWRWAGDDVAWAELLATDYADAAKSWAELAKAGGDNGRQARFYAGLSYWLGGSLDDALEQFDQLVSNYRGDTAKARYWRAKVLEAKGDHEQAEADRQLARSKDARGWYVLLMDQVPDDDLGRDGTWAGQARTEIPEYSAPPIEARTSDHFWPDSYALVETHTGKRVGLDAPTTAAGWSSLSWPMAEPGSERARPSSAPTLPTTRGELPNGYVASSYYDPIAAAKAFGTFADRHKDLWPDLPKAYDLIQAAQYAEAGRILASVYNEWKERNDHNDARARQVRGVVVGMAEWRQLFLYCHEHNQAARHSWGLEKSATTDDERKAALRLAYPIVRAAEMWDNGRNYDVDPLLVMGIMRQESTYQTFAQSPVGALGLIQVMPGTGARVAAILGDASYSPGKLTDPSENLRYGTFYLSLLLRRFEGAFPLAVGSYNGGPHNVSRWYRGKEGKVDLDVMVEMMVYDETRDYVKKVSGYYARYVELYAPAGSHVVLPQKPSTDDASIIDF